MGHIVIKNLKKEFQNRRHVRRDPEDPNGFGKSIPVLNNINLEFNEGEMVCILGPSGCGKSTLLRIIAGFDKSTSGYVLINDNQVTGPSSNNIFVFQQTI